MSMTGLPPQPGPDRDAAILAACDSGQLAPAWAPITAQSPDGHTATFYVLGDALKLNGVRLSTSARVLQQLADKLGAVLMTPRLIDLAFQQAGVQVPPCPLVPNDVSTEGMDAESAKIDAYVGGREGFLIAPIGKNWVLSNVLTKAKRGHAALYGWAVGYDFGPQVAASGVKTYKGTLPSIMNIQPLATPHSMDYVDYAMLTSLARQDCVVDGQPADLRSVLTDPVLSKLCSHEGPLKLVRQPGVAELPALGFTSPAV